jgi:anti-sigma B factor antagonist
MDLDFPFHNPRIPAMRFGGGEKAKPLHILRSGETPDVKFQGRDASESDEFRIAEYRDQFLELIKQQNCRCIAVDLTGVQRVASGILGLLVTIHHRLGCLELQNVSAPVRESLRIMKLDTFFRVPDSQA